MNILKSVQFVFVAGLVLTSSAALGASALPAKPADQGAASDTQVVVIAGKRMTAGEKLQTMQAERQHADARAFALHTF